jgi:hypothetical protein
LDINAQLRRDLNLLRTRIDGIEKSLISIQTSKSKNAVGNFVESLTATTIELNPRTVEIFAIITFFGIGAVLGASLLDRLWLIGGIIGGWWASGAVYRDTRGGMLARRVGVQVTQFVKDLQEKYNQFIIFYRTGKLAYVSKRIWDQYDDAYQIQKRVDEFKRLAMQRATDFNTAFKEYRVSDQLTDAWRAMRSVPMNAIKLDEEYGLTTAIVSYSANLGNSISQLFGQQRRELRPRAREKKRERVSSSSQDGDNWMQQLRKMVGLKEERSRSQRWSFAFPRIAYHQRDGYLGYNRAHRQRHHAHHHRLLHGHKQKKYPDILLDNFRKFFALKR